MEISRFFGFQGKCLFWPFPGENFGTFDTFVAKLEELTLQAEPFLMVQKIKQKERKDALLSGWRSYMYTYNVF